MPVPQRSPRKAVEAELRRAVAEDLKPGARVPAIGETAARHGVSRSTVRKAYAALRDEGLIEHEPGMGYWVPDAPKAGLAVPSSKQVAAALLAEIRRGDYAPGDRLPSMLRLAEAHGADLGTIRRALRLLVDAGHAVHVAGKGWFAP